MTARRTKREVFLHTEKEWSEVRSALARVGVDANTATAGPWWDLEKKPLTEALASAGGAYAAGIIARRQVLDVLHKEIEGALRRIKRAERLIDKINATCPSWLRGSVSFYSEFKTLSAPLHDRFPARNKKGDKTQHLLSYMDTLLGIYAEITEKRPVLGNENSPLVCFLFAASRIVFSQHDFTKQAIHSLLYRNPKCITAAYERAAKKCGWSEPAPRGGQKGRKNNQNLPTSQI